MRILVWHWGRHGAGPRFAMELTRGLNALADVTASLSLAAGAEILTIPDPPRCDLPVRTYIGWPGLAVRCLVAPAMLASLDRALARLCPDLAVCAMPAALDPLLLVALRRRGIPSLMIVHDAAPHPGDGGAARAGWDRLVRARANALGALSRHVGAALAMRHAIPILPLAHPPFPMPALPPPRAHGGPLRVLSFGRLRAYKDLDLLAATLRRLPREWDCRVVGAGNPGPALAALRALPGVRLENRWVPETELPALLGWADVLLLTHAEASQSGVAAAAIGAGRYVVATRVGGLAEQLGGVPGVRLCVADADALAEALRAVVHAPPPVCPDPVREWRNLAADLLSGVRAAGLVQRQPRAMAAASCSAVRSGPT